MGTGESHLFSCDTFNSSCRKNNVHVETSGVTFYYCDNITTCLCETAAFGPCSVMVVIVVAFVARTQPSVPETLCH